VDPDRLALGVAALRDLGLEPVLASNLDRTEEHGLFAGTEEERLGSFHELAGDPSLQAIFFARGGHGVLPLLPRLDWGILGRHPRAYVGYSDLTPFLLEVVRRLGLVAFHGPMVAAELARGLEEVERRSLLDCLAGRFPQELPLGGATGAGGKDLDEAQGILLGGCLSMLVSTLGTEWAPRLDRAVWFWEDVDEPLYRLDRMLTQCMLSNRLTGIRAMVVGHADPAEGEPGDLERWLRRGPAGRSDRPVAWGLECGHGAPNRTLPLGGWVRLEPQRLRLVLLPGSVGEGDLEGADRHTG